MRRESRLQYGLEPDYSTPLQPSKEEGPWSSPVDHSSNDLVLLFPEEKEYINLMWQMMLQFFSGYLIQPERFRRLVPVIPQGDDNSSHFVGQVRQI